MEPHDDLSSVEKPNVYYQVDILRRFNAVQFLYFATPDVFWLLSCWKRRTKKRTPTTLLVTVV
jgi:hypothetical protein